MQEKGTEIGWWVLFMSAVLFRLGRALLLFARASFRECSRRLVSYIPRVMKTRGGHMQSSGKADFLVATPAEAMERGIAMNE